MARLLRWIEARQSVVVACCLFGGIVLFMVAIIALADEGRNVPGLHGLEVDAAQNCRLATLEAETKNLDRRLNEHYEATQKLDNRMWSGLMMLLGLFLTNIGQLLLSFLTHRQVKQNGFR